MSFYYVEQFAPQEYNPVINHPGCIQSKNGGLRSLDYYSLWVNGIGGLHRRDLIRQIREGNEDLYAQFIERYVEQCEATEWVRELTPEFHLFREEEDEGDYEEDGDEEEKGESKGKPKGEQKKEAKKQYMVVCNDWASGMINEFQDFFYLPKTFLSGKPIPNARTIKEFNQVLQQIGKEYPHWMMEMMYIVLGYGDFAHCRPEEQNYALTRWEADSAWQYFDEVEKLPDPVYSFDEPISRT
jgi:hypothetical protein